MWKFLLNKPWSKSAIKHFLGNKNDQLSIGSNFSLLLQDKLWWRVFYIEFIHSNCPLHFITKAECSSWSLNQLSQLPDKYLLYIVKGLWKKITAF